MALQDGPDRSSDDLRRSRPRSVSDEADVLGVNAFPSQAVTASDSSARSHHIPANRDQYVGLHATSIEPLTLHRPPDRGTDRNLGKHGPAGSG